jgi:hypothetical protein
VKEGMENDTFTEAYKNDAMQTLKDSREVRTMGSRSSNTAAYADARATAISLTDEASCFLSTTSSSTSNVDYLLVRGLGLANWCNWPCITC